MPDHLAILAACGNDKVVRVGAAFLERLLHVATVARPLLLSIGAHNRHMYDKFIERFNSLLSRQLGRMVSMDHAAPQPPRYDANAAEIATLCLVSMRGYRSVPPHRGARPARLRPRPSAGELPAAGRERPPSPASRQQRRSTRGASPRAVRSLPVCEGRAHSEADRRNPSPLPLRRSGPSVGWPSSCWRGRGTPSRSAATPRSLTWTSSRADAAPCPRSSKIMQSCFNPARTKCINKLVHCTAASAPVP